MILITKISYLLNITLYNSENITSINNSNKHIFKLLCNKYNPDKIYNIPCIYLVSCQNTFAIWISLFEPINPFIIKPNPIENIIIKLAIFMYFLFCIFLFK